MKRSIVSALCSLMVVGAFAVSGCDGGLQEGQPADTKIQPGFDPGKDSPMLLGKPGSNKPNKAPAASDTKPAAPDAGAAEKK